MSPPAAPAVRRPGIIRHIRRLVRLRRPPEIAPARRAKWYWPLALPSHPIASCVEHATEVCAREAMARHLGLLLALLAPAAFAADAPEYVLELHDSPDVALKDVIGVFKEKLGVSEAQSMPLVQRISESGSSVVLMGPEVTCQKIAAFFEVHTALRHPHTRMCTRGTGA